LQASIAPRIENGTVGQILCSGRIYATKCDKSYRYKANTQLQVIIAIGVFVCH